MSGIRLEVKVHIVTGRSARRAEHRQVRGRCGLEVHDLILQPLASSLSVLTEDEKELGVVLVDIGSARPTSPSSAKARSATGAVIPIAGDQITQRPSRWPCARRRRTPRTQDPVRHRQAGAGRSGRNDRRARRGRPRSAHAVERQALAAVIEPRVEELFSLVHQVVRESGYEELLSSGVVLTGGTAMMPGNGRAGRRHFPQARARRRARVPRQSARGREEPALRARSWGYCRRAACSACAVAKSQCSPVCQTGLDAHEGVVHRPFSNSNHDVWRCAPGGERSLVFV